MIRKKEDSILSRYLEMLSLFGVAGAHPGGLAFQKRSCKGCALPDQPILDAGCGTGQTAAYLGHLLYPVTVVDKDPIMLEKAKKICEWRACHPCISGGAGTSPVFFWVLFLRPVRIGPQFFTPDILSSRNFKSFKTRRDADWYRSCFKKTDAPCRKEANDGFLRIYLLTWRKRMA